MSYYIFKNACATKETGPEFPQIQKMGDGYNYDAIDSVDFFSKNNRFPDFVPNLDHFVLQHQAKVTDLLSSVFSGVNCFIVSKKFRDIVSNYKLPNHNYYSCTIKHKNSIITDYYLLQIISDYKDFVDYKSSAFIIKENYSKKLSDISITSEQDFLEKTERIKKENKFFSIWVEKVKLKKEFDKSIELFSIANFDRNFYISNILQEELVRKKVTGIETPVAHNIVLT
jgi:hypothetical protein